MSLKSKTNTQVIYKQIPKGLPIPDYDFQIKTSTIVLKNVELKSHEVLLRILYLSVDPYMRGRMRAYASDNNALIPGKPMEGGAIGEILKSSDPKFPVGHIVVTQGQTAWEEYTVVSTQAPGTKVIQRSSYPPLSFHLGVLGLPGMAAYVGLHKICEPLNPGQTLYVSAAAGAVGHIVGQYGKILGLRVVGSAGSTAKINFLKGLGFDAVFNYKEHSGDFVSILKESCPNGIDIYFDNVGGRMLDAVLTVANDYCRIVACGMISQYNRWDNPEAGGFNWMALITKRIRMEGFNVKDEMEQYGVAGMKVLTKLVKEKKIQEKETVTEGIQNSPEAFVGMMSGKNFGKALVKVAEL